ncbi:AlpA family transcriptional regulator [Luteitalea sp.]|uniref:helix-turn-helix transcriptional regulator n=1 Tax=Luteitalea sp. TaxID=2004800 RepID=UPI0034597AE7
MPSSITSSRTAVPSPPRTGSRAHATRRTTAAAGDFADGVPLTVSTPSCVERLLRLRDVLAVVGLSRAHVYHLVQHGLFPPPIPLGSNCVRWVQSEVHAWVEGRIASARDARARSARPVDVRGGESRRQHRNPASR